MKHLLIITSVLLFVVCKSEVNAQQSKTLYRQTLIIKNNKPIIARDWQIYTVRYLDVVYQYNRELTKRRKTLIVFGKEGVSPVGEWIKYEPKENDTLYNYKPIL